MKKYSTKLCSPRTIFIDIKTHISYDRLIFFDSTDKVRNVIVGDKLYLERSTFCDGRST